MKKILAFILALISLSLAFAQNIDIWNGFSWKNSGKYSDLYYWENLVYRLGSQYIWTCNSNEYFQYDISSYTWDYSECFSQIQTEIIPKKTTDPSIIDLVRTWGVIRNYDIAKNILYKNLENWFSIKQDSSSTSLVFWNKTIKSFSNSQNTENSLSVMESFVCPNTIFETWDFQKNWNWLSEKDKNECRKSINLIRFEVSETNFDDIFSISIYSDSNEYIYFDIASQKILTPWEKRFCWVNGISYPSEKFLLENWLPEYYVKKAYDGQCKPQTCSQNTYVCAVDQNWNTITYKNKCYANNANASILNEWICDQYSYFSDETESRSWNWELDALEWAYENYITSYSTWKEFKPNNFITREQAAKMIDFESLVPYSEGNISSCLFKDSRYIDPSLYEHVQNVCRNWLIKWDQNWNFNPQKTLTAAQALTLLVRAIEDDYSIKNLNWIQSTKNWWDVYKNYAYQKQILQKWVFELTIDDSTSITRKQFLYLLARVAQYKIFHSNQ